MAIKVALNHVSEYRYDRAVTLSPQLIRLRPAPHCRTDIPSYSLRISPKPHFVNWQQDAFGNWQARVMFPEKVEHFRVEIDLIAELATLNPFDFFIEPDAEAVPFVYRSDLRRELAPFLRKTRRGKRLQAWLDSVEMDGQHTITFLVELCQRLQSDIKYLIRMEPGVQTPETTLRLGCGSCRDSAWLLVQILRQLGFAARFVSGYLIQLKPDEKPLDGPDGPEDDFTDLHAWCEVYVPGAGWLGMDATSGLFAGEGHIPLVATPQPASAAPISGMVEDCEVEFGHSMAVSRVEQPARVTLPFTDSQWRKIDALGFQVDAGLAAADVRLTMGGEPTFVSIDAADNPQWNSEAVGEEKLVMGGELLRSLGAHFAPGAIQQFSQGKWYPGESLPRWSWSSYWRGDGEPLWSDPQLLANSASDKANLDDCERFISQLTKRLKLPQENILQAFEDPWHFIGAEQQLPEGVDPLDNDLADPEQRRRLAKIFARGLNTPRGFVLPVQRQQSEHIRSWVSELWPAREGRLLLSPGDAPIGLRLPLDKLPVVPEVERPRVLMQDPFVQRDELPSNAELRKREYSETDEEGGCIRTALCVEPAEQGLRVFLPPCHSADDFASLLACVETTAAELTQPIVLDGYGPPSDPRLQVLKVTPDPGVLEVNVQPAANWHELKNITLGVYAEARARRLTAEKFMLDGRHGGTGGGNHIVVGGPTAADSPFLRRPDLLGSFVRYFQRHPSLSYLFSGMFIGPTSQAPRVDEGRDEILAELELALTQLAKPGEFAPLWQPDRILRNLLVDLTGNTHRSEICIDKLYSPIGPTGRLGLVEFRGFEMPPHGRMSLLQQLLIRALLLRFWEQPCKDKLIPWGNALRDRFMMPHFLQQDLLSILEDLGKFGLEFDAEWFQPQIDFRCPVIGSTEVEGIELELRMALEAWPVMGEEPAGGGTTRYVDSSVERVQVKVRHRFDDRYQLLCNQRPVPLQRTGVDGEWVAAVRYRAWQPWSSLHPNIPADVPLRFDIYDRESSRSVGGCSYHVEDPAGRNHEQFPINSLEAEARRRARFEAFGHSPGQFWPAAEQHSLLHEFPHTLDLRWTHGQS